MASDIQNTNSLYLVIGWPTELYLYTCVNDVRNSTHIFFICIGYAWRVCLYQKFYRKFEKISLQLNKLLSMNFLKLHIFYRIYESQSSAKWHFQFKVINLRRINTISIFNKCAFTPICRVQKEQPLSQIACTFVLPVTLQHSMRIFPKKRCFVYAFLPFLNTSWIWLYFVGDLEFDGMNIIISLFCIQNSS